MPVPPPSSHPPTTLLLSALMSLLLLLALWALAGDPASEAPHTRDSRYIVRLKDSVVSAAATSRDLAQAHGLHIGRTYEHAFAGFSASMPASAAEALRRHPLVDAVEPDQVVRIDATRPASPGLQADAPWGLDRIDQRALPLDATYRFLRDGLDVRVYVVDSGILASHAEFAGRVVAGHDLVADGRGTTDCNGHGTHVAGTIGGATWGVAKGVTLVPVRVLDCQGTGLLSTVLGGLDRIAREADGPAVVNLSVSTARSDLFDAAVAALDARGLTVVAASGNGGGDACLLSPAREPTALTVGASTAQDERAPFSNRGRCVDLYAPGEGIASAWHTAVRAAAVLSGTSMAAPHASGVAALAIAANPSATPGDVRRFLKEQASHGTVRDGVEADLGMLLYSLANGAPATRTVAVSGLGPLQTWTRADGRSHPRLVAALETHDGSTWTGPARGATVRGRFEPGGLAACTTDAQGVCTLTGCGLESVSGALRFEVLSIVGEGLQEDPGLGLRTARSPP